MGRFSPGFTGFPLLLVASHLLLLPFLLRNVQYFGMRLILVGLLLNLAAMVANGGMMPVTADGVEAVGRHQRSEVSYGSHIPGTKNVLMAREDVHLRGLTDSITLPIPGPMTRVVSLGDILVAAGTICALLSISPAVLRGPLSPATTGGRGMARGDE
jgi:hypothetical protein